MDASEKFLRFAGECELMATSRPARGAAAWRRLAERWIRCAELSERQISSVRAAGYEATPATGT